MWTSSWVRYANALPSTLTGIEGRLGSLLQNPGYESVKPNLLLHDLHLSFSGTSPFSFDGLRNSANVSGEKAQCLTLYRQKSRETISIVLTILHNDEPRIYLVTAGMINTVALYAKYPVGNTKWRCPWWPHFFRYPPVSPHFVIAGRA